MSSGRAPFRVTYSQKNIDQIAAWLERAASLGIKPAVVDSLRHIADQLKYRPLEWGDPYYNLRSLGIRMYRGWHAMFHVYYGVDDANRVVYISEYRVAPGHILGQPPTSTS